MTADDRKFLSRINKYKENLKKDMGPQKVQMPAQLLDKLRPIMEEIAAEQGVSVEDVLVRYMDLQSEASFTSQKKLEDSLQDLNDGFDGSMPLLFR